MPPRRPRRPRGRGRPRAPGVGRQLNPRLQRELRRANHLMSRGEHENAAQIFHSLAQRAQDRGILGPAAMMFLQTAHAFLLGGQVEQAIEQGSNGLKLFAADRRWPAVRREGERLADALEREGYGEEAQELRAWVAERLSGQSPPSREEHATRAQLPEKCPYCGASMSLEQMRGAQAAECRYCGSVVLPSQMDEMD